MHPCYRYSNFSQALNVSMSALFEALVQDSEVQSPNWDLMGRQANIWKSKSEHDGLSNELFIGV